MLFFPFFLLFDLGEYLRKFIIVVGVVGIIIVIIIIIIAVEVIMLRIVSFQEDQILGKILDTKKFKKKKIK